MTSIQFDLSKPLTVADLKQMLDGLDDHTPVLLMNQNLEWRSARAILGTTEASVEVQGIGMSPPWLLLRNEHPRSLFVK